MRLLKLAGRHFRCFEQFELRPGPGLNLFTGGNGAGKTSLLEALYLLAYGRSFRGRVRDGLVRSGQAHLEVFAEWQDGAGRPRRAGLRHSGQQWEARLDGSPATSLTKLCAELALVCFEPGSHELIAGGSEQRRRFLDWALFHVEPGFLPVWRRYARALKQRNALLKQAAPTASLDVWDIELAEAGESLTLMRSIYLDRLQPVLSSVAGGLLPELGPACLHFTAGWRQADLELRDALVLARERDLAVGHSTQGPHRADWRLQYAAHGGRESLSRGQAKLTALACVLAQAQAFSEDRGEWPVICLDDLASELDQQHQAHVMAMLAASGAQVWISGTEPPREVENHWSNRVLFHVEQGCLRPA